MRAALASAITLCAIAVLILIASSRILAETDAMIAACDALETESTSPALDRLAGQWERCRDWLALAVHSSVIERADAAFRAMRLYHETGTDADFLVQLDLFREQLKQIADEQRFSPGRIL